MVACFSPVAHIVKFLLHHIIEVLDAAVPYFSNIGQLLFIIHCLDVLLQDFGVLIRNLVIDLVIVLENLREIIGLEIWIQLVHLENA